MIKFGIVSQGSDIHAHSIVQALRARGATAHLFAADNMYPNGRVSWDSSGEAFLADDEGASVSPSDLNLVWWRRVNTPQVAIGENCDPAVRNLIDNEWRATLTGLFFQSFRGVWVNDPAADSMAGNKLFQLRKALAAGFRIPNTLVSNDPESIRRFYEQNHGSLVVKKLAGTLLRPLATLAVSADMLQVDEHLCACPAMYQEKIVGRKHLRINCFGENVIAIQITSPHLDWRRDLSVPFLPFDLPPDISTKVKRLIVDLGLRMGVMDMMIEDTGEFVWIELNTQGQFLFGEAKAGVDLTTQFVDFLFAQAGSNHGSSKENKAQALAHFDLPLSSTG